MTPNGAIVPKVSPKAKQYNFKIARKVRKKPGILRFWAF